MSLLLLLIDPMCKLRLRVVRGPGSLAWYQRPKQIRGNKLTAANRTSSRTYRIIDFDNTKCIYYFF